MAVQVRLQNGNGTVHHDATWWHVDDAGLLHIRGKSGNMATYGAASWAFVVEISDVKVSGT